MCKVTNSKFYSVMDEEKHLKCWNLLELAALDDISRFVYMVEEEGVSLNEIGLWYGRSISGKVKMGFVERTPLMIASVYGSSQVLKYIIGSKKVDDVNKRSDSDGATALHCAAAGGSLMSVEIVKILLEASADVDLSDHNGNKAGDLIARGVGSSTRRGLEMLLKGFSSEDEIVSGKKEYPVDVSMPDINEGVYGSDEFRMYTFKVKPCSRAYTHDWTECPFVHPGENARRRDLNKFSYTCVPCPEFRKGSCVKGDSCEYAHGVFESWLHPAQYKTRLCKDEIGCARKVCFFAHIVEEMRPVYAFTGSAFPSPKSLSGSSPPPMPMSPPPTSPMRNHLTPPSLQLPGSRLKTSFNARDLEIDIKQQRRQVISDLSNNLYNTTNRFGEPKPINLDEVYGSLDQSLISQFHGLLLSSSLSPKVSNTPTQLQSPTNHQQFLKNSSPIRSSYPSPSPVRKPSYGFDSSAAVAQAVMNSRSGSFSNQRSQSFIDRGAVTRSIPQQSSKLSEWGSPDGKLEWGFSGDDASKLRKSASFGYNAGAGMHQYSGRGVGGAEKLPQWMEQIYIEQEQIVA